MFCKSTSEYYWGKLFLIDWVSILYTNQIASYLPVSEARKAKFKTATKLDCFLQRVIKLTMDA